MLTKALTMVTMVETVTQVVEITATKDQDVTEDLMEVEEDRDLTVMLEEEQEMMSQDIREAFKKKNCIFSELFQISSDPPTP